MTGRVLAGRIVAITFLAFGVAACGEKRIDKEGTVERLVERGEMTEQQARCAVDRIDAEFGDDSEVIEELTKSEPELGLADEARVSEIVAGCLAG